MKKAICISGAVLLLISAVQLISCNGTAEKTAEKNGGISNDSLIKRGSYLVSITGCDDCHSPKIMGAHGPEVDMSNRLSGHPAHMPLAKADPAVLKSWVLFNQTNTAVVGPWGVSYASNITSSSSGIGNWTEAQFIKALREGKSKGVDGGRMILPPMPWQNIGKASDEDLKAMFAYLKSTKPVDNIVPQPIAPDMLAKQTK